MDDEYKKIFLSLQNTIRDLRKQLDDTKLQLNHLERNIKFLALKMQESDINVTGKNDALRSGVQRVTEIRNEAYEPTQIMNSQKPPVSKSQHQSKYQSQSNASPSSEQDIIAKFNALAKQGGHNLKTSRDDFIRKYNVRAFNCSNFEERMNEPVPAPKFIDTPTAPAGEYWAVPLKDNMFAVFPNIKNYSDNHHTARAMGVVFSSNFTAGRTYNDITIEQPAIFVYSETVWSLKHKGILRLG